MFNYFALVLITNNLCLMLLRSLPLKFIKSFSFGEFSVISQCVIYYLINIIRYCLDQFGLIRFFDTKQNVNDIFINVSIIFFNTKIFYFYFFQTCYLCLLLFFILANIFRDKHFSFLCYFIFFPLFLYINLFKVLSNEPITWLANYLFENQTRVIINMDFI